MHPHKRLRQVIYLSYNLMGVFFVFCQLKSILSVLKMSQDELADTLGLHRNTITNLARNKTIPRLDQAYAIVDTLNDRSMASGLLHRWSVEEVWTRGVK